MPVSGSYCQKVFAPQVPIPSAGSLAFYTDRAMAQRRHEPTGDSAGKLCLARRFALGACTLEPVAEWKVRGSLKHQVFRTISLVFLDKASKRHRVREVGPNVTVICIVCSSVQHAPTAVGSTNSANFELRTRGSARHPACLRL